jgi:signal transduction histidine kinase
MALALVTLFVLLVVWNFAMYVLLIGDYQRQLQAANAELEGRVAARTHDLQVTADELRVTAGELRHANAGKDAFMAAVSHELRTPLTGILSMSEVLQLGVHGPLSAGQARSVGVIAASGKRLLATVNRVLLYTQLVGGRTPIQQEPCPLADLCAVAVRAVQAEANRKQQQLAQSVEPRDLEIESDPEGICNILTMLLDNAVKFTPEGGQVCVHICAAGGAGSLAGSVQIVVADTGIGMSAEELERLFLPFTQADMTLARRFEGVGVGLAYVQAMVDRLGGAIAVASTPQVGTRFTITLPAVMPAAAPV